MKQKEIEFYMSVAESAAKMSHAVRLKVGCCVVTANGVMVYGYNGTLAGQDNCCENEIEGKLVTKPEVAHAEWNALSKAAREGISTSNSVVFLTHSPCQICATLLASFGVSRVIYKTLYRDNAGVHTLRKAGVIVSNYEEAWFGQLRSDDILDHWYVDGITSITTKQDHTVCAGRLCV